jgi:hypothetical protein
MATRMQQRRGTAAQWISTNSGNGPVLNSGEIGYESDTNKFKIGDGVNHWLSLPYFVDLNTTIAGAPGLLNSLDELAAAIGDDPAFFTTVATNLTNHQNDTTAIHGIADTSLLVTTTGTQTLTNKTITSPAGLVKGDVGLGNVDNTTDANKPVSTATQTALDLKANSSDITELAQDAVNTAIVAGTGLDKTYDDAANTITIDIDSTVVTKTGTETLTNKTLTSPLINTPNGLTKSDVGLNNVDNTSDSGKPVSIAAQTALDLKAPKDAPTFTGTVSGITKTMVGLGNVDNTSDANKPISDAVDTALFLKAPKASPTFTGTLTAANVVATDLVVNGNLTVNSGEFLTSATSITIQDNLVQLASANAANTVDLGIVVGYNDGTAKHSGIVRDVSSDRWKLFKGVTSAPTTTVDFTQGSLDNLQVNSIIAESLSIGNVTNTEFNYLSGTTSAIQTQINTKAPTDSPTFTGTVAGITKTMVGLGSVDNTTDANKPVSTATQTALDLKAPLASPTFTGTVSGVTATHVGLGNVDNTTDANKPVSTAAQAALDLKANLASPTFTGTVSGITKTMVGLSNVDNTTDAGKPISSDTQTALDLKAPLASPTFTGTVSGVTKSHVGLGAVDNTADSAKPISTATQTALDLKLSSATAASTYAPIASPTFTGTVAGITSTMVGLGNVDNTSDANKPVSTATQTALDAKLASATASTTYETITNVALKAPLASPALTGVPTAPTAAAATNTTQIATTAYVRAEVAALVNSAGSTLDTLGEIATALGNDANLSTTLTTSIGLKAPLASPTFTGTVTIPAGASISGFAPLASPTFTGTNNVAALTASGLITASASGVAFTDGTQTKAGVPSITTISQKTDSYTLSALTERDSMIEISKATAVTLTVPTNATVAYPVGTSIDILQTGAGQVTVAGAVGVTVNATPGLKLRAQWSSATLIKRATDTWVLLGDLSA